MKELLLVTSGYHVGSLLTHFFGSKNNDFIEMGLHHICALYLYGGCYIVNGWELGQTIAFLHDIADIGNMTRFVGESKDKIIIGPLFIFMMAVWFYTRVLVLPYLIWKIAVWPDLIIGTPFTRYFFCWLLTCMFFLHCFWFSMFVKMITKFFKKGETEDVVNKSEVTSKKDEWKISCRVILEN